MKKIFIFSLMLASFLFSEAKERSLQQKLEIASEVLGERLPSVGGKTSRGGAGENLRVMRQTDAYTVVGRNRLSIWRRCAIKWSTSSALCKMNGQVHRRFRALTPISLPLSARTN